jgi:hypothetical protein
MKKFLALSCVVFCGFLPPSARCDVDATTDAHVQELAKRFGQTGEVHVLSSELLAAISSEYGTEVAEQALVWASSGHGVFRSIWWGFNGHKTAWTEAGHDTETSRYWADNQHAMNWSKEGHETHFSWNWQDANHVFTESLKGGRRRWVIESPPGFFR